MTQTNTNTQTMTNEEARAIFDEVINKTTDPDQRAMRELLREYFTNPAFRAFMEETVWNLTKGAE